MLLPLITSSVVAVVEGSWMASSILVKYFLVGLVAKNLYQDSLTLEQMESDILESSEIVVVGLMSLGAFVALFSISPAPLFRLLSELVALGYFGFLFWKY